MAVVNLLIASSYRSSVSACRPCSRCRELAGVAAMGNCWQASKLHSRIVNANRTTRLLLCIQQALQQPRAHRVGVERIGLATEAALKTQGGHAQCPRAEFGF